MFVENYLMGPNEEMENGWYPIPAPSPPTNTCIYTHTAFLNKAKRSVHTQKLASRKQFKLLNQTIFLSFLKIILLYIMASTFFSPQSKK